MKNTILDNIASKITIGDFCCSDISENDSIKNMAAEQVFNIFSILEIDKYKYYYADDIKDFFMNKLSVDQWNYYVRMVADVEYFFSAILYLKDRQEWLKLKEKRELSNLSVLYEKLGLQGNVIEDLFYKENLESIREIRQINEAYKIIFKVWWSLKGEVPYSIDKEMEEVKADDTSYAMLISCLINVYCDLILQNYGVISKIMDDLEWENIAHLKAHCERIINDGVEIINETDDWEEKNIEKSAWQEKYVQITWKYGENSTESLISKELRTDERKIKLIGNAGVGKTTTLKYLQWKKCKEYLEEEIGTVPVYIALCDLGKYAKEEDGTIRDGLKIIQHVVDEKLRIKNLENTDVLLKSGKISLYLDGYNEISSSTLRESICGAIKNLTGRNYEKLNVIVSDRNDETQPKYWFNSYARYKLIPLTDEQIKNYFETKIEETNPMLTHILNALDRVENGGLSWLKGGWAIPFDLQHIMDWARLNGLEQIDVSSTVDFPEKRKFKSDYLYRLLKREEVQWKDRTEEFSDFLKWLKAFATKNMRNEPYNYEDAIMDAKNEKWLKEALRIPIIKNVESTNSDQVQFVYDEYQKFCKSQHITSEGSLRNLE